MTMCIDLLAAAAAEHARAADGAVRRHDRGEILIPPVARAVLGALAQAVGAVVEGQDGVMLLQIVPPQPPEDFANRAALRELAQKPWPAWF